MDEFTEAEVYHPPRIENMKRAICFPNSARTIEMVLPTSSSNRWISLPAWLPWYPILKLT